MKSSFTTTRSLSFKVLVAFFLAGVCLLLLRPLVASKGKDKEQPKQAAVSAKSFSGESNDLASRIASAINESDGVARWGISVISMADGSKVYERNGDKLFTPASNMKIYTTGVALDLLGVDYRWRTSVYANAQTDASGRVSGDLILYGRGAPDPLRAAKTRTAARWRNSQTIHMRKVRSVSGMCRRRKLLSVTLGRRLADRSSVVLRRGSKCTLINGMRSTLTSFRRKAGESTVRPAILRAATVQNRMSAAATVAFNQPSACIEGLITTLVWESSYWV